MPPGLGLGSGVTADPSSGLFAANLFLDNFPSAHGAYSLRKLSSTYTGICCRIRRYDDADGSNEADLHFNNGSDLGEIDFDSPVDNFSSGSSATNLGEWVSASGYTNADGLGGAAGAAVVTWKDQSSNGRDVTNATSAEQPSLVHDGALKTENGKVALDFSTNFLKHSDASSYAQPNTYIAVIQSDATSDVRWFLDGDGSGGGSVDRNAIGHVSSYKRMWADDYTNASGSAADTDQNLWFAVFNGASTLLHINGGSDVASGDPGDYAISGLTIGSHYSAANEYSWDGRIQEIIYYRGDQSGSRAEMESDVNTYYSIY